MHPPTPLTPPSLEPPNRSHAQEIDKQDIHPEVGGGGQLGGSMLERLQPRVHSPPKQPENESRRSNTQLVDISMETRNNVPEFTYDIICRLLMENMTLRKTIFMGTPPPSKQDFRVDLR